MNTTHTRSPAAALAGWRRASGPSVAAQIRESVRPRELPQHHLRYPAATADHETVRRADVPCQIADTHSALRLRAAPTSACHTIYAGSHGERWRSHSGEHPRRKTLCPQADDGRRRWTIAATNSYRGGRSAVLQTPSGRGHSRVRLLPGRTGDIVSRSYAGAEPSVAGMAEPDEPGRSPTRREGVDASRNSESGTPPSNRLRCRSWRNREESGADRP